MGNHPAYLIVAFAVASVLLVLWLSIKAARLEREMVDESNTSPPQAERLSGVTWGGQRVLLERWRQQHREGYHAAHDAAHSDGSLAAAAMAYAAPHALREQLGWGNDPPFFWPWAACYWKPGTGHGRPGRIRELEKAGALIVAELDRLHAEDAREIAALAAGRTLDPARA